MNKSKNSIVDPRVIVEIHGAETDNDKKQTRVIDNNGKWRDPISQGVGRWDPASVGCHETGKRRICHKILQSNLLTLHGTNNLGSNYTLQTALKRRRRNSLNTENA